MAALAAERDALQVELQRQKALIQELNHRIKNSLQLVSSLFRLQGRRVRDVALRAQFDEASARISTIALIHQQLYREGSVETLDLGNALTAIGEEIGSANPRHPVEVDATEGIRIRTDQAVPLALAVGELVSNALRHAYPEGAEGGVTVRLERSAANAIAIGIADEGIGLPESISLERPSSFGMMLVANLAAQVGGQVVHEARERGTAFLITVPEKG